MQIRQHISDWTAHHSDLVLSCGSKKPPGLEKRGGRASGALALWFGPRWPPAGASGLKSTADAVDTTAGRGCQAKGCQAAMAPG